MGRSTTLLYHSSYIELEESQHELLFWSINKDKYNDCHIMPKGCKNVGDHLSFKNSGKATSSEKYKETFGIHFNLESFHFVSESATKELANYLKKYEGSYACFVINDDLTGGEDTYVIRARHETSGRVDISIELMNFDGGMSTYRVNLEY